MVTLPSYQFSPTYFITRSEKHNGMYLSILHTTVTSENENTTPLHSLFEDLEKSIQTSIDSCSRKASSLESELEKAKDYEKMLHKANLITANLYQIPTVNVPSKIIVIDWENDNNEIELSLNTEKYATAQEEADALFRKARKLKRGTNAITELLLKNELDKDLFQRALNKLEFWKKRDISDVNDVGQSLFDVRDDLLREVKSKSLKFALADSDENYNDASTKKSNRSNTQKKTNKKPSKTNFRTFFSPSTGHKILVGKNRKENEKICFQVAKSNDLWLHARGVPGAHVLICSTHNARIDINDPKHPITEECLQYAANLAAFYSESRREVKTFITVAQPKHIVKPRNAPPGAVKLRQELRTIIGNPFDVPDELKEKRGDEGVEVWSPVL